MNPTIGIIDCNWTPTYTLTVPSDWTSGVYMAVLTNADGDQNYVVFVVKDGRPAAESYNSKTTSDDDTLDVTMVLRGVQELPVKVSH